MRILFLEGKYFTHLGYDSKFHFYTTGSLTHWKSLAKINNLFVMPKYDIYDIHNVNQARIILDTYNNPTRPT